jgi:hypothetical protein
VALLRAPSNGWDFFDVPTPTLLPGSTAGTRNKVITISDVLAVPRYVGTSAVNPSTPNANGAMYGSDLNANGPDGQEYDRTPSTDPNKPWLTDAPNAVVSIADVLVAQTSVGDHCN